LASNPFAYDGKAVLTVGSFVAMESSDTARFTDGSGGEVLVVGLPAALFKVPGERALLAIRLGGKSVVPGGTDRLARLVFLAEERCREERCLDLDPPE
jgi:hypothetical protein